MCNEQEVTDDSSEHLDELDVDGEMQGMAS